MKRFAMLVGILCIPGLAVPAAAATQSGTDLVACDGGDMAACNSVGISHELAGRHAEAARYFRRVCDGGQPVGCSNLAEKYYDGRGVQRDLQRAQSLWLHACEQGVTSGCAGLCVIGVEGAGLAQDQANTCRTLLARACDGGNPWMCAQQQRAAPVQPADNGCRTGAESLANAYVRSNPLYSLFFGDIKSYVDANRPHFAPAADAIRCARALSASLFAGAVQTYDPSILQQRQELDAQLGSLGIQGGGHAASQSEMLFAMANQIGWLGRVLPAAAAGNYEPLLYPDDELIQLQAFAGQMLVGLMQDPTVRAAIESVEGLIREAATAEYRLILHLADQLEDGNEPVEVNSTPPGAEVYFFRVGDEWESAKSRLNDRGFIARFRMAEGLTPDTTYRRPDLV